MDLGVVEIGGSTVRFAVNEEMIWVNMADMLKIEAGDPELAAIASDLAVSAKRMYPKEAEIYLKKFPYILRSGKVSGRWNWFYRIDTNLAMLAINQKNSHMLNQKIHVPIRKIADQKQ